MLFVPEMDPAASVLADAEPHVFISMPPSPGRSAA
jgi:hypothetical protein